MPFCWFLIPTIMRNLRAQKTFLKTLIAIPCAMKPHTMQFSHWISFAMSIVSLNIIIFILNFLMKNSLEKLVFSQITMRLSLCLCLFKFNKILYHHALCCHWWWHWWWHMCQQKCVQGTWRTTTIVVTSKKNECHRNNVDDTNACKKAMQGRILTWLKINHETKNQGHSNFSQMGLTPKLMTMFIFRD